MQDEPSAIGTAAGERNRAMPGITAEYRRGMQPGDAEERDRTMPVRSIPTICMPDCP